MEDRDWHCRLPVAGAQLGWIETRSKKGGLMSTKDSLGTDEVLAQKRLVLSVDDIPLPPSGQHAGNVDQQRPDCVLEDYRGKDGNQQSH
jgi:hypothetical protein